MRKMVCRNCGFVNETQTSSWASQKFLCVECGSPVGELNDLSSIAGSASSKVNLSMMEGKGLGVVATTRINKDELIERCPVMVLGTGISPSVQLHPYEDGSSPFYMGHLTLPWVIDSKRCIAFGYGTFYNHSDNSNAFYRPYVEPNSNRRFIDFYAKRDIERGEEITQTYAPKNSLWFSPKE